MIVHIVLGRIPAEMPDGDLQEVAGAMDSLRSLPQVQSLTHGRDFSGRGQGYTYGAVVLFHTRADLQSYATDERHLRVVEVLNRLMPDRLVVDYEVDTRGMSARTGTDHSPS